MDEQKESRFALLFAVFGFMLIIATGVDFLLGNNNIPIVVSIIGLVLIIIAMALRKRERIRWNKWPEKKKRRGKNDILVKAWV